MNRIFHASDPVFEAHISSELALVEKALLESTRSEYPFVSETSRHLVVAGGKRFRPLLVLLAAEFGDPKSPEVIPAAVVVELTHLATLYHDDVMDEATMRRGCDQRECPLGQHGCDSYRRLPFRARASQILAGLGPDAVRIQAETFERLCTGQIKETVGPLDGEDPG